MIGEAQITKPMKRILIIGCPGAGKSTAARAIEKLTGLPVIHLDRYHWLPGWVPLERNAWRTKVQELAAEPFWIMDGNYGSTLRERSERADTLIHLDYPTWLCVFRVVRRTLLNYGRVRPGELVDGCPERFDLQFLLFVLRYRKHFRARDVRALEGFKGQRFHFTRPSSLRAFLSEIRSAA